MPSPMNLSSVPPCRNTVSTMWPWYAFSSRDDLRGRQGPRQAGEAADVGEQHRQLLRVGRARRGGLVLQPLRDAR